MNNPKEFGIVELDADWKAISLEEKPKSPKSNYAVTGLCFYDSTVVEKARRLCPSARGDLEITDLNRLYLDERRLAVQILRPGCAWLDTRTHDSLLDAGQFISTIERRQGLKVACPEEITFWRGWISADQLLTLAIPLAKSGYGQYLRAVASGDRM